MSAVRSGKYALSSLKARRYKYYTRRWP